MVVSCSLGHLSSLETIRRGSAIPTPSPRLRGLLEAFLAFAVYELEPPLELLRWAIVP